MKTFQQVYDPEELACDFPEAIAFLSTTAQGKFEAILESLQFLLEAYERDGYNLPSSKAEIRNFQQFLYSSTLVRTSHLGIIGGSGNIPNMPSKSISSIRRKKSNHVTKSETSTSTLPVKKEMKKEVEKEVKQEKPKAAKPKSNSDFEMFNYSMTDNEVKTSSSAPASIPLKKEAKEKAMTTQQPKAETKNGEDDYITFKPDMSYFTPPEDKEADNVPRKPILGKRSPII